jgi:hypothetical protein
MTIKVSTLTACWGSYGCYLKRFLESFANQSFFKNMEVVLLHYHPKKYELEFIKDFQKKYTINWDSEKEDENALYIPTLLIEQIWMFDLFKLYRKDIVIKPYYDTTTTFLSQSIIDGIYHIWGFKHHFMYSIMEKFSEKEIDYDKSYKDFNYNVSFLENFEKRQKQNYSDSSTEESFLEKFDLNE